MAETFDSLEVMSRLLGAEIETRDIVDRWLLLTYDIPHNEEGDKARREFLNEAKLMGATQHTESVYLLPWTPEAELAALRIARVGQAIVWTSSVTDKTMAKEITRKYDAGIKPILDEIANRIDRMVEHREAKHYKRLAKMFEKTEKMLNAIERAILRRGSKELLIYLGTLRARFANL